MIKTIKIDKYELKSKSEVAEDIFNKIISLLKVVMQLIKRTILSFIMLLSVAVAGAQELNCSVQVNSSQIQGSDKSIFDAMQKNVFEFMNNRKWTNNVFKNEERIECSILINITEQVSTNLFKATIQVQSRRPVYNTSYFTTLINHIDKEFEFEFNEF